MEYYQDQLALKFIIQDSIERNKPFLIGRLSGIESKIVYSFIQGKVTQQEIYQLENNAGIKITSIDDLKFFVRTVMNSFVNSDGYGAWQKGDAMYNFMGSGQELIKQISSKVPKFAAQALEPFYFLCEPYSTSWLSLFRNKRLLVISPFVESIKEQIGKGNIKKIFNTAEWLKDITFDFVKPPVTLAGNHDNKSWKEHFEKLKDDVSKIQFDVALVSCGGYGMPICYYIKNDLQKSAMYIGGALQLFFGIIGKRWESNSCIRKYYNDEYWKRPNADEYPKNFGLIEKGCYW